MGLGEKLALVSAAFLAILATVALGVPLSGRFGLGQR